MGEVNRPMAAPFAALMAKMHAVTIVEDEHRPHILVAYDPELADEPGRGVSACATGPYPDLLSALAAAEKWSEGLNKHNGPDDPPWEVIPVPLLPPRLT